MTDLTTPDPILDPPVLEDLPPLSIRDLTPFSPVITEYVELCDKNGTDSEDYKKIESKNLILALNTLRARKIPDLYTLNYLISPLTDLLENFDLTSSLFIHDLPFLLLKNMDKLPENLVVALLFQGFVQLPSFGLGFTQRVFTRACSCGFDIIITRFLTQSQEIKNSPHTYITGFYSACENNHLSTAKIVKEYFPDIPEIYGVSIGIFVRTLKKGYTEVARWLREQYPYLSYDIRLKNYLYHVCEHGFTDTAEFLLTTFPELQEVNTLYIAFNYACCKGRLTTAQWMKATYPNIGKNRDNSGIFNAVCWRGHLQILKWLCEIYPETDLLDTLKTACLYDQLEIAKWLQEERKVEINPEDFFFRVCLSGHIRTAKWLRSVYENLDVYGEDGQALFWCCVNSGRLDLAEWLSGLDIRYPRMTDIK